MMPVSLFEMPRRASPFAIRSCTWWWLNPNSSLFSPSSPSVSPSASAVPNLNISSWATSISDFPHPHLAVSTASKRLFSSATQFMETNVWSQFSATLWLSLLNAEGVCVCFRFRASPKLSSLRSVVARFLLNHLVEPPGRCRSTGVVYWRTLGSTFPH